MAFLDNTGLARLWQHILIKVDERLTIDPSITEEGVANLINADSLGGILAKDYALKDELGNVSITLDPTLTLEGTAADAAAVGRHINNKNNPHGVTAEQIGALPLAGGELTGWLTAPNLKIKHSGQWSQLDLEGSGSFYGLYFVDSINGQLGLRIGDNTSGYYENYHLSATSGLTANQDYTILSTKAAVTIAQGGTGATNAADARLALGITADWIQSCLSNASGVSF